MFREKTTHIDMMYEQSIAWFREGGRVGLQYEQEGRRWFFEGESLEACLFELMLFCGLLEND